MTKFYVFREAGIDDLNLAIWKTVYNEGEPLVFGDAEEVKRARYVCATTVFEGPALESVLRGKMPDGWLFHGKAVKGYGEQFDNREMWKGFVYTYAQRLLEFEIPNKAYPKTMKEMLRFMVKHRKLPEQTVTINQLEHMREQLKEALENGIQSTRIISVTFQPHKDYGQEDIPCLLVVQVLPLPGRMAEIHFLFRSHDLGNGIMANMHQLTNAINRHVIAPEGAGLKRVVVTSWVGHLYENDMSMIEKVVSAS